MLAIETSLMLAVCWVGFCQRRAPGRALPLGLALSRLRPGTQPPAPAPGVPPGTYQPEPDVLAWLASL